MQLNDDIVSGWLSGSDSIGGYDNPAGPLFIEGAAATEAAMTADSAGMNMGSTSSCSQHTGHCDCC